MRLERGREGDRNSVRVVMAATIAETVAEERESEAEKQRNDSLIIRSDYFYYFSFPYEAKQIFEVVALMLVLLQAKQKIISIADVSLSVENHSLE